MNTERSLIQQFIEGGWYICLIGAAGMLARLLANPTRLSYIEQFKKIVSAAILAGIAWFILEQTEISSLYKAISYGIVGVVSPEVLSGIVKLGKKFQSSPEKFIPQK